MALRYISNRVKWKGEKINGISHPRDIEEKWSLTELNSIGLEKYMEMIPEPPNVGAHAVTNYQARTALINANIFDQVEHEIRASGNKKLQIAWDYAMAFERNSPFISLIASKLNLSEQDIDNLFNQAARIT